VPGQIDHPEVRRAMGRVAEAARSAGKWWGTVAVGPEMCARVYALGARLISPGGDVKVMQAGVRELVKTFGGLPAAHSVASSSGVRE